MVIHAPQAFASISNVPILVAQPIAPLGRLPPNHQTRLSTPSTRPGGARTSMLVASSRARTCPKIFAINCGSSAQARTRVRFGRRPRSAGVKPWRVQAITLSLPPQSGQVSISIANTRLSRCAQVIGASGLSCSTRPCGRRGTIRARCLQFGAKTRATASLTCYLRCAQDVRSLSPAL